MGQLLLLWHLIDEVVDQRAGRVACRPQAKPVRKLLTV